MWNGILWLLHTILALGTTPACKSLFPEEVYLTIGFKADLSIFGHTHSRVNFPICSARRDLASQNRPSNSLKNMLTSSFLFMVLSESPLLTRIGTGNLSSLVLTRIAA